MPRVERPHMPGYGVPDDPDGLLPWVWAEERLVGCRNYWLVTASRAARPHALPVWGVWASEPDRFAFSCAPGSRKAANLHANPQATATIDNTVECVSVEGRAHEVARGDREPIIAEYAAKYEHDTAKQRELAEFLRRNALWAIRPERAFGIIEREHDFARRATRWTW